MTNFIYSEPGSRDSSSSSDVSEEDDKEDFTEPKIRWVHSSEWREVKNREGVIVEEPALLVAFTTPDSAERYEASTASTNRNRLQPEGAFENLSALERPALAKEPNRIAINSRLLASTIQSVTGENLELDRNVLVHPFKILLTHESKLRGALDEARIDCAEKENLAFRQKPEELELHASSSDHAADAEPNKNSKHTRASTVVS